MSEYADILACYRSGQIPEAAWQEHLKDEGLRAYVEGQTVAVCLDPRALTTATEAFNSACSNVVMVECKRCEGKGYHHGFGEDGADPDWCSQCGGGGSEAADGEEARPLSDAIRAYLSAAVPAEVADVTQPLDDLHVGSDGACDWVAIAKARDEVRRLHAAALTSMSAELAAVKAERARLYDSQAPMADGEVRMTAAEDVLAWLLVEKIGVPDDQNYTPDMAQQILSAAIDGRNAAEAALAEARKALELHIDYEATPADRGGSNGTKGKAWAA